jgi:hypothetical protein
MDRDFGRDPVSCIIVSEKDRTPFALADYLTRYGGLRVSHSPDRQSSVEPDTVVIAIGDAPGAQLSTNAFGAIGTIVVRSCVREAHLQDAERQRRSIIADPVTISLGRLLGGTRVCSAAIVENRPSPRPTRASGPLDSFRIDGGAVLRLRVGDAEVPATHQLFTAPHTRCRLVACTIMLETPMERTAFLARASRAEAVLVGREDFHFTDTAVVVEFFRDLGNGLGYFTETVLFDRTVVTSGNLLSFAFAVHELAAGPDLLRQIATLSDRTERLVLADDMRI